MDRATITEARVSRPLCRVEDLADGRSRGFDPLGEGRDTMFIVRRGGRLFAWRNSCPHYDRARMAWRKDEFLNGDRSRIMCAAHGAMFEIETGICTIGPCLGRRLTAVDIEVRDGEVWITGPYAPGLRRRPGARHD
ncbi:MAG: hypothetical protein Kow0026_16810 [Oricola sp.]